MFSWQEWLQKKKAKLRENIQLKKKEELLKEKKKKVKNLFCNWKYITTDHTVIEHYKLLFNIYASQTHKQDEEAKKEDAVASYEAWKEKKAGSLKEKAKEKQDMIRKEQRAIEEKEEKKQSAKQVYWLNYCEFLDNDPYKHICGKIMLISDVINITGVWKMETWAWSSTQGKVQKTKRSWD